MRNLLFRDVRTNQTVRVIKELNETTVMVVRLRDKKRYITDISNLKRLDIKGRGL